MRDFQNVPLIVDKPQLKRCSLYKCNAHKGRCVNSGGFTLGPGAQAPQIVASTPNLAVVRF